MVIVKSVLMSGKWLEDKIVRITFDLRKELNVSLGEFIRFENDTILQVDQAFSEDIKKYGKDKLFVTDSTFNLLNNSNTIEIVDTITMGCDPELFIINKNNNNVINPAHFFRKWDVIGCDGMLCELRPIPHVDPEVVTNTLYSMINTIQNTYIKRGLNDVMSYGSSAAFGLTAGFHCHMGIPKNLLDKKTINYKKFINIMIKVLDYYVGTLSIIPEGTSENQRRCAPFISYGKVSDHRVSNRTLEYRVPGGTLLKSPELTCGLLSLCSLVSTDVVSKLKNYTNNFKQNNIPEDTELLKELYPNVPGINELFRLICSPDNVAAITISKSIFYDLSKMLNYNKHTKNINIFKNNMQSVTSNDIWNNWKDK